MIFMQRNLLFTFPVVCWTGVKFRKINAILSILDISDWTFAMVINEKFLVLQVSRRKYYLRQLFDGTWSFLLVLRSDYTEIFQYLCVFIIFIFFSFFSRMVKFEHPHVDHIFPLSEMIIYHQIICAKENQSIICNMSNVEKSNSLTMEEVHKN